MALEALLDRVSLPATQIHPMDCATDPVVAARSYQRLLQDYFFPGESRFDLILLGLGEDGYTSSLFPDTGVVEEKKYWVAMVQKWDEAPGK